MDAGSTRGDNRTGYRRDYYGGGLMMLIGSAALLEGWRYHVGSLVEMGPGFFPVALGAVLVVLGLLIAGTAGRSGAAALVGQATEHEQGGFDWRGWTCILVAIAGFAILGRWGGLLPATFFITFVSALGDRDNSLRSALVLATAVSTVCVVVFWWALQLQFPLFVWG